MARRVSSDLAQPPSPALQSATPGKHTTSTVRDRAGAPDAGRRRSGCNLSHGANPNPPLQGNKYKVSDFGCLLFSGPPRAWKDSEAASTLEEGDRIKSCGEWAGVLSHTMSLGKKHPVVIAQLRRKFFHNEIEAAVGKYTFTDNDLVDAHVEYVDKVR